MSAVSRELDMRRQLVVAGVLKLVQVNHVSVPSRLPKMVAFFPSIFAESSARISSLRSAFKLCLRAQTNSRHR